MDLGVGELVGRPISLGELEEVLGVAAPELALGVARSSSSRASAYARIVSSIVKRGSPSGCSSWRSRLLSTSVASPVRTPSAPQTASAASSVQPPAKTARPREELPVLRAEQVVAPVDRRAERLLARRLVARPAGEQLEAPLEPGEQRLRREQLRARGRELDRERQAVEADADLGDRGRVRGRHGEVGLDRLRALDEERDRVVLRELLELRQVRRVGQAERRHLELVLAGEPERRAARGEQLHAGAPRRAAR